MSIARQHELLAVPTHTVNSLCLPGGLRAPSNLPMPPDGVVGPPEPLSALGGGIFKEPVLMCLYSVGILWLPWLNMVSDSRRGIILVVDVWKSEAGIATPPRSGGLLSREGPLLRNLVGRGE